jgi:hypothetical protein
MRIPGIDPQQSEQQTCIDIAKAEMAEPADEGKRHGVGDVGADQALGRQDRIKRSEHGDADGTGAHGRQRHEQPKRYAEQHGLPCARRHVADILSRRGTGDKGIENDG